MPLVVFYHGRKKHFSRNMEGSTQLRRTKKRNAKHESHLKRVSKPWRSWKQKLFKSITHEKPSKQKPNREIVTRVDKKINVPRQKNFIQKKPVLHRASSSLLFFLHLWFIFVVPGRSKFRQVLLFSVIDHPSQPQSHATAFTAPPKAR